jgi:hypothetical protein
MRLPKTISRSYGAKSHSTWPALLGIVTDLAGNLTGLQRTWLARDGSAKAPLADPRRAIGHLLGNAVRFGAPRDIMAAGEGIETVLSLLSLFPACPWRQVCPPRIFRPSRSRLAFAVFMSSATMTLPAILSKSGSPNDATRRASRPVS